MINQQRHEIITQNLNSINSKIDIMTNEIDGEEGHYGLDELNMQLSWALKNIELIEDGNQEIFEEFWEDEEILRLLNKYKVKVIWDCKYEYNKDKNKIVAVYH